MKLFRWILAIVALGLLGYGFHVAMTVPADEAMFNVQRIFYYHIPAWIMTSLCFGANLIGSVVYLAARNKRPTLALRADAVAVSTAEMGVVFCLVGLVTGSLWARYAWGIWWTWDERLTSTLILWLIYVSYLLLRNFSAGPQMRTISAVLAIFGYIDVPIVYMSTRWWRTQHPGPGLLRLTRLGHRSQHDARCHLERLRVDGLGTPRHQHPLRRRTPPAAGRRSRRTPLAPRPQPS